MKVENTIPNPKVDKNTKPTGEPKSTTSRRKEEVTKGSEKGIMRQRRSFTLLCTPQRERLEGIDQKRRQKKMKMKKKN
ncbi:hypothetical protein I7I53_02296 [Histoplasma capsulatum var. duboisii H88]|uniref:Uncharacterized protein n=1 Tax=Ajellomyces capsulatus (strain H88) TaxID=544711 RepID=A0A8A1LQG6_AJEC8|nr:hypothetical protein I7I53_02296 [Histoplasma capsulatum var. duboisii H88]